MNLIQRQDVKNDLLESEKADFIADQLRDLPIVSDFEGAIDSKAHRIYEYANSDKKATQIYLARVAFRLIPHYFNPPKTINKTMCLLWAELVTECPNISRIKMNEAGLIFKHAVKSSQVYDRIDVQVMYRMAENYFSNRKVSVSQIINERDRKAYEETVTESVPPPPELVKKWKQDDERQRANKNQSLRELARKLSSQYQSKKSK